MTIFEKVKNIMAHVKLIKLCITPVCKSIKNFEACFVFMYPENLLTFVLKTAC